ncbi:hypothetical protein K437DRAFT_225136 [Tilletiaria anomala UBC 951]|uniref:Uncharacterized protein n=1 Tax=Tilletiaria anomala (strain ATCC 24038 / CBS 436.72 / UBC 951) TaxID=1037660 RepID=A0A066VQU3_TILAU|nr:uncharacterized protein K437DRAFT_225136 [Tilletiaria anomala UBC 951]KDN44117.1 hypothetical protein K437DRAFT_225136 [Tilletiaria anomala UBC 951]
MLIATLHPCIAIYSIYTSPNHAPIPNHLPTLIVTPYGQPHHTLYSYIHTNFNKETYLLTPSPQGDLCVAKMVPPHGSRGPGGPGAVASDPGHSSDPSRDRSVRCEASRNLKWSITNTGIHAPVYKLTLPNPDAPGNEQPLFQVSKPNPNANWWTLFYFTYAGHLIPPKRIEFGKIQRNSGGGGGGTRVTITGKSPEEKAVWQTLGEGNEDMVEWIVLCAALNVLDEEIIKAAEKSGGAAAGKPAGAVPSSRPSANARAPGLTPTNGPVPRNAGPAPISNAPPTNYQGRVIMNGGGNMRPPMQGMPARGPSPNAYSGYGSPQAAPQVMRGQGGPGAVRPPPPQGGAPYGQPPAGYGQMQGAGQQGYRPPPNNQGYPQRAPPGGQGGYPVRPMPAPQQQQQQQSGMVNGRRF